MNKYDVQINLEGLREDRSKWVNANRVFNAQVNRLLNRLIHEAVACFMSVEEFSRHSKMTKKQVRALMRRNGMEPRSGKRLLADTAAKALTENAALLGVEPHEVDLLSPLAYLPAGSELRQRITDQTTAGVTELDGPFGDAEQMAQKLTDAGLSIEDARVWVNDVITAARVSGNNQ